ncbi:hypothetical protein, partial [Pseudomonas sp.]|uniref:hypothetical protein n=1 Tax=Pseudomonas sp. TaxID=306 RepID=UPI0025D152F8
AGLLALASVLGVGEGHLLHRETRWVGSRYFAKSESLFQSFLNTKWTVSERSCCTGLRTQLANYSSDAYLLFA